MPTPLTQLLPDVYPFADYLGKRLGTKYIIGVGELAADNLKDFLPDFEVIGVVHESIVQAYSQQYEFGTWLGWDQQSSTEISLANEILESAIIVCTMVMDRLETSAHLLQILKGWLDHAPVCLLTISEKDLMRLNNSVAGFNDVYQRDFGLAEIERFLRAEGFYVEFIGLTATENINYEKQTILAVLTNRQSSATDKQNELKTPADFRVVAFMAAYNEEDIIVKSIKNWTDQGVHVHLLENWSTDATYELARQLEGQLVTVERFPADGPSDYFDWSAMLERIEALASELEADWFVRRGADEVLMSPWPGLSYRDGLYLLHLAGYNCVDHTVINFYPVDNDFKAGLDHESYFQHFVFGKHQGDFQQIKAWKNDGPSISMAKSGGHDLKFSGRRLYPFKFLLKHYPFRSQEHGERKIFRERRTRWNVAERARGWHNQYDHIQQDQSFVISPSRLTTFIENGFYNTYLVERLSGVGVKRPARKIEKDPALVIQELRLRLEERDGQLKRVTDFLSMLASQKEHERSLKLQVQELTLKRDKREAELKQITDSLRRITSEIENVRNLNLAVQELTVRLDESDARLKRITESFGWRLLSRYGKIKYRFLLPAYEGIGRVLRPKRNVKD